VKAVIRVDASVDIGIGHVMRCLSLADQLHKQGFKVHFVCRVHLGHMGELIVQRGHTLSLLPEGRLSQKLQPNSISGSSYSHFLGETWDIDLAQTKQVLIGEIFDWLVVDHYGLDYRWEIGMRQFAKNIMIIDDLVDRKHDCDLLLDQTFGRKMSDYKLLVPKHSMILAGSKNALLRPEFRRLRHYSLKRRTKPKLRQLLISMGGTDSSNATGRVLQVLKESSLPIECKIIVVMGASAPWLESVRNQVRELPWQHEVKVNVTTIAKLMSESDLAIGAAGSTAWERCCLGLPTIMFILADNQKDVAYGLEAAQAVILLDEISEIKESISFLNKYNEKLGDLTKASSQITDGSGLELVSQYLEKACG